MALESMKDMLDQGKANGYAVGQFNINNLEYMQAFLQAAEDERSRIIVGVSDVSGSSMCGFNVVVAVVESLIEEYGTTVSVAIHLDHGLSFESCALSIFAFYRSVIIAAASKPLE